MPTIVLDGLNGSGTSTQCNMIKEYLDSKDIESYVVRIPGSNDCLGKEIRKILKYGECDLSAQEELMLFATDSISFYKHWIEQLHDEWIICDRSSVTSMVYQIAKGASFSDKIAILNLIKSLWNGFNFDYLFVLNSSFEILSDRMNRPNVVYQDKGFIKKDNFESTGVEYLKKVNELYNKLHEDVDVCGFFKNVYTIDVSDSIDVVFNMIISKVGI